MNDEEKKQFVFSVKGLAYSDKHRREIAISDIEDAIRVYGPQGTVQLDQNTKDKLGRAVEYLFSKDKRVKLLGAMRIADILLKYGNQALDHLLNLVNDKITSDKSTLADNTINGPATKKKGERNSLKAQT